MKIKTFYLFKVFENFKMKITNNLKIFRWSGIIKCNLFCVEKLLLYYKIMQIR